jgi:hypothetical protein
MWKRLFPTLAEWDGGKWIALPVVVYLAVGVIYGAIAVARFM